MENNKSMMLAVIAAIVLIGGGIGIYAMTQNDDEDTSPATSQVTEQESSNDNSESEEATPAQNIVELAVATDQLSTLVTAVTEADLVETLSSEGPFTVLAPTNDAFTDALEALDITVEELLAREDLADILTYHVISGSVLSSALTDGMMVETVQGGMLEVDITDDGVFFVDTNGGRAQVTTPDVKASNGIVHVIDAVLLP